MKNYFYLGGITLITILSFYLCIPTQAKTPNKGYKVHSSYVECINYLKNIRWNKSGTAYFYDDEHLYTMFYTKWGQERSTMAVSHHPECPKCK